MKETSINEREAANGVSDSDDEHDESHRLVEHFFRHESANLIAVLTRAFGFGRIDLIEDSVQAAMIEAMNAWKLKGAPNKSAAWIHRVARNRVLDVLRREKTHDRALALAGLDPGVSEQLVDDWLEESQLTDSLLRMIFVCCHPSLERQSRIALTLKILCGFGVDEIARALLMNSETVRKRIQRAKTQLAEMKVKLELPKADELHQRLTTVHDVLYLIFNEGYSPSKGADVIRDDVCEEAARLCHLLCEHAELSTATTRALLALMLFHAARLESRTDDSGNPILLEDQDRSKWDQKLIGVAKVWLSRSKCDFISRFHVEATISLQHCIAESVEATAWPVIVELYDRLIAVNGSPLYILNRAIAIGQTGDIESALKQIDSIRSCKELSDYFFLECAAARLHETNGNCPAAIDCYLAALSQSTAEHEKQLLERKLLAVQAQMKPE